MVLHSTYHKPIFSAREWDGRASCADGEKIARSRRTGYRSVELPCDAPQCNRRITCSGTYGSSIRHTTARCERIIVATSTPKWGHPKLRSTCQNDVQAMLRSATRCTQITAVTKWRTSVADIGWEKQWSTPSNVFRSDSQNRSYVVKTNAGICYRRNRKHLQCVPNVLPSVTNDEPDDTDIQAKDPGEGLPPDVPGDAARGLSAGLYKS